MSHPQVAGPCRIYFGTGTSGAMQFIGYTKDDVRPEFVGVTEPVFADYGGPSIPVDHQFFGESATVGFELTTVNEFVLQRLMSRLPGNVDKALGSGGAGILGTMLRYEGGGCRMIIESPYPILKSAYSDMVAYYNFPFTFPAGPIILPKGTRNSNPRVLITCLPIVNPANSSYTLFTTSLGGITLPTPD